MISVALWSQGLCPQQWEKERDLWVPDPMVGWMKPPLPCDAGTADLCYLILFWIFFQNFSLKSQTSNSFCPRVRSFSKIKADSDPGLIQGKMDENLCLRGALTELHKRITGGSFQEMPGSDLIPGKKP